jgi:hypothetical protein
LEFELELRKGGLSVRVRASNKDELLDKIEDARLILESAGSQSISTMEDESEVSKLPEASTEVPAIFGAKTCREAILKLASTPWGRTPRTLGEFVSAMKTNAIYYSRTVVAVELQRMTRLGLLRRLRTKAGYTYVLAKPP